MTTSLSETKAELEKKLDGLAKKTSAKELLAGVLGIEKIDKALLILLDGSGSMSTPIQPGSPSKIEIAWQVFKDQLAPNLAGWAYGIIMFGDSANWLVYPQTDTRALTTQGTPRASGLTAMGYALRMSWSWVRTHAKQARLILLSDGQPNDMGKGEILDLARTYKHIPIDTVGIGKGYDYDPDFLRQLSNITGGLFSEPNDVKMLSNTIKSLSPAERPLLGTVKE